MEGHSLQEQLARNEHHLVTLQESLMRHIQDEEQELQLLLEKVRLLETQLHEIYTAAKVTRAIGMVIAAFAAAYAWVYQYVFFK